MAMHYNISKVAERLPQAIEKLAQLSLRYCVRALGENDEVCGSRYYHLAAALMPGIVTEPTFLKITDYWKSDVRMKSKFVNELKLIGNLVNRNVSYDPPPGSVPLECA